jgi:hypothetical protein
MKNNSSKNMKIKYIKLSIISVIVFCCSMQLFSNDNPVASDSSAISNPQSENSISILPTGYEPRYTIYMPNAGMLGNAHYAIGMQMINNGGFVFEFTVAPFPFLNLGVSYGGSGIVGNTNIEMQYIPGFHLKSRIINETEDIPAFAIGFNSQGGGQYSRADKRFEVYSPGFYLAVSKCYSWYVGQISLHAGLNYSIDEGSKGINGYCGFEQIILKYVSLNVEFNPNFNETNNMKNKLILNTSLRFKLTKSIMFEFQFRDLFKNSIYSNDINRFIGFEYISKFK